ncbi:M24 family metallopeptidase [Bacillus sp. FSL K6-3431]|uniref:M24 family metallopeptidase n=1 Tax=Bacillus sp. FSL K6-3431 TaxID=2921500 RepID=UPI0030F9F2D2
MVNKAGYDCGIVYSDEHYCGDVPYLAGNNNIAVEPIAGVITENGFYFIAGLESGIIAPQFSQRSQAQIRSVEIMKIDDKEYPEDLLRPADIIEEACGRKPKRIALLTTRYVFPLGLFNVLRKYIGEENIEDLSEKYYEIKYEKSDNEMRLIEEGSKISDIMMEGMLRVLRPGMYETQLAQWGYAIAHELGVEEMGFMVMVTAGDSNKTMVGRASNNIIKEGDIVHIGVSPKRDGLSAAQRGSVVCVKHPDLVPDKYKLWIEFLEGAFEAGVAEFNKVVKQKLPGCYHEQAMIDYYHSKADELSAITGITLTNFAKQKGYVTTHNSGYTECQEFYGALSLDFNKPLANQMVMMMDTGIKGYGETWDEVIIPDLDYIVIEKTLGKYGDEVRILNDLPINLQHLVGEGFN